MYKLTNIVLYFVLLIIILIPCFKCAGKDSSPDIPDYVKAKWDTARVGIVYKSALNGSAMFGVAKRVYIKDTLSWKDVGNNKMEKKRGPDYYYLIPYNLPITDSLGNQKKDSTGKPIFFSQEIPTDKKFVRSGFENLDSAIKELNDLK